MALSQRYPDVQIRLAGKIGNAFLILGTVQKALREAGVPKERSPDSTSGDYDHLLATAMAWVDAT
jgi:hypothetical protein